jgi:hypothetical protein
VLVPAALVYHDSTGFTPAKEEISTILIFLIIPFLPVAKKIIAEKF